MQALAAMSKRQLGAQLHEAVLTSLTALSRSASSITNRNVDSAVDYVFEQVSPCWSHILCDDMGYNTPFSMTHKTPNSFSDQL